MAAFDRPHTASTAHPNKSIRAKAKHSEHFDGTMRPDLERMFVKTKAIARLKSDW